MKTGFISLTIICILLLVIPLFFQISNITPPSWIYDMLGGFVGTMVAIIGSVSFQLLSESHKGKLLYEKNLILLKQEIYDNFIVSLHRIINNRDNISFFEDAYKSFIICDANKKDKVYGEMKSEISKLYFVISRGNQILKTTKTFTHEVINLQKKTPKNFEEVKDIIQGTGIDYIYEFAIIRYILLLNKNYNLNIELPFNDFQRVVKHNSPLEASFENEILFYITEQVCKTIFKNDRILYYYENFRQKRDKHV